MQLNLLDLSGKETANKAEIQWIAIDELKPHPDNPRLNYREEIITAIASSIEKDGFQPPYALLVRPFEDGYQVIAGHTRLIASLRVGVKKLPCWVKEMSDKEALAELRKANRQGELSYRERAQHTFVSVIPTQGKQGGKRDDGKYDSIEAYSKDQGISLTTASEEYKVGEFNAQLLRTCEEVYRKLNEYESETGKSLGRHLLAIAKVPEQYYVLLTELLIKNEWSVKQTEEICKAVRDIDIPEYFEKWLNAEKYIKEAIKEFEKDGKITIVDSLKNWIKEAQNNLDALENHREIRVVLNDKETISAVNPQKLFLKKLNGMLKKSTDKPSGKKIVECYKNVLIYLQDLDKKFKKWKDSKANNEQKRLRQEREGIARAELVARFTPHYLLGDCRNVFFEDKKGVIDLILTDPPYLLSNDGITCRGQKQVSVNKNFEDSNENTIRPNEWLQICYDYLKDGGVLVYTCTDHIYSEAFLEAQRIGFKHLETLIWYKKSAPPRLTTSGHRACFEYIAVFKKGESSHYFAYDNIKEELGNKQPSAVLEYEQCSGEERKTGGGHDTQKPLQLWEYLIRAYSRPCDDVLDIFSGSGTTAVACKKTGRIGYWIEKKEEFFNSTLTRLENTKYHFETDKKVFEQLMDEILNKTDSVNNKEE